MRKRKRRGFKTWVRSLGQDDPQEEEMATHSSILAWRCGFELWVRSLGQDDPLEEEMATHTSILAWRRGFKLRVRSLGRYDPLEEEMATHSSMLAWKIPWTEEPDGWQSMGSHKSWTKLKRPSTAQHNVTWRNGESPFFQLAHNSDRRKGEYFIPTVSICQRPNMDPSDAGTYRGTQHLNEGTP